MEKAIVREMTPSQCEIMVGRRRVGYVCYGERMPINFLSEATSGLKLTESERLAVAKEVREQMITLNAAKQAEALELRNVIGPNYQLRSSQPDASDKGPDTQRADEADDEGGSCSGVG